jgi:hypothetical protein
MSKASTTNPYRDEYIRLARKDMMGPYDAYLQKKGEEGHIVDQEILVTEHPLKRYGIGILEPQVGDSSPGDSPITDLVKSEFSTHEINPDQKTEDIESMDETDDEQELDNDLSGLNKEIRTRLQNSKEKGGQGEDEDTEATGVISTQILPSSCLGITIRTQSKSPGPKVTVQVKAGFYISKMMVPPSEENGKETVCYLRRPVEFTINRGLGTWIEVIKTHKDGDDTKLQLRCQDRNDGYFTLVLVNTIKSDPNQVNSKDCYFQCTFAVTSPDLLPINSTPSNLASFHRDEQQNFLLYRNRNIYGLGHGCAAVPPYKMAGKEFDFAMPDKSSWLNLKKGDKVTVIAEPFPVYELDNIVARPAKDPTLLGAAFSMAELAGLAAKGPQDLNRDDLYSNEESLIKKLKYFAQSYSEWVTNKFRTSEVNRDVFGQVIENNQANTNECATRIQMGIDIIAGNPIARHCFAEMNAAMLDQQLHNKQPTREVKESKGEHQPNKPWSRPKLDQVKGLGNWRPFQLAFVLMNIPALVENPCFDEQRKIVDVIWFPTGGGKTEAYLGLSAFTILYRRLKRAQEHEFKNPRFEVFGSCVITRYTLRLLTGQQFERASTLVCALELKRKKNPEYYGQTPIRIGIWIGKSQTHNDRQSAVSEFRKQRLRKLPILSCPWCRCEMGFRRKFRSQYFGYDIGRLEEDNGKTIRLRCVDPACDFSTHTGGHLPLLVIDEDIYTAPPEVLIGTIDKFAQLPRKTKIGTIFGYRNPGQARQVGEYPPSLIIQDELHLISGPLGSIAGGYEAMIDLLASEFDPDGNKLIGPKVIGATATISRAQEQAKNLYAVEQKNVKLFPPPVVDAGESFFATVVNNDQISGRKYVGLYCPCKPSQAATQRLVFSSLYSIFAELNPNQSHQFEADTNFYQTLLTYFNSIRELGAVASLLTNEFREDLNLNSTRKKLPRLGKDDQPGKEPYARRYPYRVKELTSRIDGTDVTSAISKLEKKQPAVEICLATSIIATGVDIDRLGLMLIVGQPKTTADYIQASSRVGRSGKGPGAVFVLYSPSKPRDRSLYEQFYKYHDQLYASVEPTSVTPYSKPARERITRALLVSYLRYFDKALSATPNFESPYRLRSKVGFYEEDEDWASLY